MPPQTVSPQPSPDDAGFPVYELYRQLLEGWNLQDAHAFAAGFTEDSDVVGYDGSQMKGRADIEVTLSKIFAHHKTAAYIALVREIRFFAPHVALLRAVVGMIPPGSADLNPERNAVQSLLAQNIDNQWRIVLFQNTPARFDGRPEMSAALTQELRQLL